MNTLTKLSGTLRSVAALHLPESPRNMRSRSYGVDMLEYHADTARMLNTGETMLADAVYEGFQAGGLPDAAREVAISIRDVNARGCHSSVLVSGLWYVVMPWFLKYQADGKLPDLAHAFPEFPTVDDDGPLLPSQKYQPRHQYLTAAALAFADLFDAMATADEPADSEPAKPATQAYVVRTGDTVQFLSAADPLHAVLETVGTVLDSHPAGIPIGLIGPTVHVAAHDGGRETFDTATLAEAFTAHTLASKGQLEALRQAARRPRLLSRLYAFFN